MHLSHCKEFETVLQATFELYPSKTIIENTTLINKTVVNFVSLVDVRIILGGMLLLGKTVINQKQNWAKQVYICHFWHTTLTQVDIIINIFLIKTSAC